MKRYAILLAGLIAVLSAIPSAPADIISATLKFTRTQDVVTQADRAAETGDIDKALFLYKVALNAFTEIMAEDPDFQPDMIEFRMAYCDDQLATLLQTLNPGTTTGTVPQNATNTVRAVETLPHKDVSTVLALARDHLEEGEPEAARAKILEGFKVDPDSVELRLLAGLAQCQARRFGDAIFLLKELAIEEPSHAPVRVGLAAAYLGDGQRDAAREELEAAHVLDPTLPEPHYNMAQLLLSGPSPDRTAASNAYHRALQLGATPDPRLEAMLSAEKE